MACGGESVVEEWRPVEDRSAEVELVHAILRGDRGAFELLVSTHSVQVTSVVRRFTPDPNDLEDAVQETFLRAYRNLKRFRGEASLRTWLIQIALNVCRDRRRTFWKRRVVLAPEPRDLEIQPGARRGFEEHAALQHTVARAVDALPEELRLPFVLHVYEELSGAEVAQVLGWNPSTVWSRIYAARKRLQKELGHLLEG